MSKIYVISNDNSTDTKNKVNYLKKLFALDNEEVTVENATEEMLRSFRETPILEYNGNLYSYTNALKII